ncbi:sigma-70 family RNA polymerase sigma factor [Chlorogloeopsis sp. ULAP01]|uniref:RNA polymerase sigma factor n=1 Tax=Chlorogloeopsis sp. ULAP01 TaxID=3056483 RepID=UPI0025AB2527|nr:sigma-70 family RNA polymerase sigma factor [Chlorogloeopsis sp. ULAP01]MDM9385398.1 sigma-70 family RNA polymerase sigma factor [Chlorogloeopsis sp. ULAP01]
MNQERSPDPGKLSPEAIAVILADRSDESLAQAACEDYNAFAILYRRHVTDIYRYLLVQVGRVHDAEDLTTQTFEAALQHIASYQEIGKFRSWLLGIARRKAADYFRQRRATLPLEFAKHIPHPDTPLEECIDQQLRLELVASLLHFLTPERSEELALRLFGRLTIAEVAHVMGKSEAAVKMLVHRAMSNLKQQLINIQKEN